MRSSLTLKISYNTTPYYVSYSTTRIEIRGGVACTDDTQPILHLSINIFWVISISSYCTFNWKSQNKQKKKKSTKRNLLRLFAEKLHTNSFRFLVDNVIAVRKSWWTFGSCFQWRSWTVNSKSLFQFTYWFELFILVAEEV